MSLEPQAGISSYFLAHATGGLGTHHMVEFQIAVCLGGIHKVRTHRGGGGEGAQKRT